MQFCSTIITGCCKDPEPVHEVVTQKYHPVSPKASLHLPQPTSPVNTHMNLQALTSPITRASPYPGHTVISVALNKRYPGDKYGFVNQPPQDSPPPATTLKIVLIEPGQLLDHWNHSSLLQVCIGSMITSVNGIAGDVRRMREELQKDSVVLVCHVPDPQRGGISAQNQVAQQNFSHQALNNSGIPSNTGMRMVAPQKQHSPLARANSVRVNPQHNETTPSMANAHVNRQNTIGATNSSSSGMPHNGSPQHKNSPMRNNPLSPQANAIGNPNNQAMLHQQAAMARGNHETAKYQQNHKAYPVTSNSSRATGGLRA